MRKTLQFLVSLFVALSVHSVVLAQLMPILDLPYYYEADYSATLQVGVPATGTISADEDMYSLDYGPKSQVRGYTVALKEDVKYTICITVRTADGKPANLAPSVALLTADKDCRLEENYWSSSSSSEVYSRVTYTPGADGNYCVLGANCFDGSSIDSVNFSISVYETPDCTLEDAEYTTIGLGENTGTLSFASDSLYYSHSAKFLKVSLKAGETYNINYQLSKKAKGAYGLAPYIAIDGGSSYFNGTDFADSCSVETITITPSADVDCKMAIWNTWGGPVPGEYGYKLTIRQLDTSSGLDALDCNTKYAVGSVISGSLNADDKQIYCNDSYYGYAEGYSVNVPDDGNQYAYFFKEESDKSFKRGSVVFFKETFGDGILENSVGYDDPMCMLGNVPAGQYKLALMSDQMNSADYKFAVRKVATQASDIDFSRKLTVGKSQSEYADPFSTQPFSALESFFAYYSGYSVELEKGVTYRFSTTAKDVLSALALFAEGDMELQYVMSNYDDETNTYSAEFYYTPKASGTYKLVTQFARGRYGFVDFDTPVKYMVEEVSSLADLLNNATELTGTHTAQLDFSKDAQLFDSGLEGVGMLLGKAYKMSLAKGEMLMENWIDDLGYLWFHKDAEGKFQMSYLNGSSNYFYYTADADTVLYFVLAVQPNVSNEKVSMSGFVCKPIEQLLDSAVEVAQLPYSASGMFNVLDKGAQMCVCPSGVPSGGFCGAYKLNIAKGEYVNYSFGATADVFCFVYSKVDGEYVMSDSFSGGSVKIGGYDKDTTFYVANAFNGTMSPYKVAINNDNAITLFELFDGATEIGNFPFYAEGNSAQNSTLANIREYTAEYWDYDSDYITYANAYKLSLKAGESVRIDYSSSEDAYMLLYSKNAGGTYDFIDSKDGGNDGSFYGDGENYDFTAPTDTTIYIYVAPYNPMEQTDWAFNVVKKQQIKTPVDNAITLFELFDGATEIGSVPFYAEGNSADSSTLANIREYTAEDWSFDFDYITYANAYKLSLKEGEKVQIDYSSTLDAFMLLYSKNAGGTYDFIDSRDGGNDGSFYGDGENYDFTAESDMELYIYVAPYYSMVQTNWAFNVVKDKDDINTPDLDFITLFDLFDGATEIGSVPFYAEGNSADNSTLANIREYTAKYWYYDSDYITYANAYKLSLEAGESVTIGYSSMCDAFMLLYSKNAGGTYDFIDSKDGDNYDSFYGNGEYYDFTATTDTTIYIYVAPYDQLTQTNWAFNVVMDQSDIKTPVDNIITLTELFDGATEIGNLPFYAEGNSAQNSTLANIREYTAEYWDYDSDYITYANAYKLSLEAGESVTIDYSSMCYAYMLLYSKNAGGTYDFIDSKDGGNYDSFYGNGEYYDFTATTDTTIYIYVAPYNPMEQTDWAFNVVKGKKVPSAHLTFADLLDNATEVDMNALHADGYAMYFGEATELYNTSNYIPYDKYLTTTAVAYKFLVPAGANISLYNLKDYDFEGFYFRKTANGYEYCDRSIEKLMRESAGDTLYVVSLNYAPSTYDYMHVLQVYENVTELKYTDLMFEQEPTKEDVMAVLFENNPYFVNCFGDTVVISMDEIERNGYINGCNINMAGHELTYYVSYNPSISSPMDRYRYNISEITARFGVPFTLAVSTSGNGTVNSNVSGKYLKDTEVVISAVPAEHYHFVQWSNGSTKATDTIMVVSDTALVAEFAIDTYNVELSAENGTVTGAGEYGYGSAVKIVATPAEGFHFVQWSNGSLKATDTIMVVSDTTLVAEFAAHQYGAWDTTLVATCTASGLRTHACACGETEVDTIPAHGHTIVVDSAVAATCSATGLTEGKHCSVCDSILVAQQTVAKLAHTIVVDSAVAATCSATGLTEGSHCSVCDSILVAQQVIPMLANEVTNVEVTTLPAKTTYKQGEALDVTGGVVTVTYSEESADTFDMLAEMVSGFDSQKLGTQQLVVKVSGVSQTATFEVTVEIDDAINDELANETIIYAFNNTIVVENATEDIFIYDANGRMMAREAVTSNRMEMQMTEQGIYVVRTGDKTQRVFVK